MEGTEEAEKLHTRTQEIGATLGKRSYIFTYNSLPYTLFTTFKFLSDCKVDVGDINHSRDFCRNYAESLAEVVKSRTKKYLSTSLLATGDKPPVLLSADKFTYQHWTRQATGGISIFPGSHELIQAFYMESPKCIVVLAHT